MWHLSAPGRRNTGSWKGKPAASCPYHPTSIIRNNLASCNGHTSPQHRSLLPRTQRWQPDEVRLLFVRCCAAKLSELARRKPCLKDCNWPTAVCRPSTTHEGAAAGFERCAISLDDPLPTFRAAASPTIQMSALIKRARDPAAHGKRLAVVWKISASAGAGQTFTVV